MNPNTEIVYKKAWSDFLSFNRLTETDIKNYDPVTLTKMIDATMEKLTFPDKNNPDIYHDYCARSRVLKTAAVRHILEYNFDKVLPKSKLTRTLRKEIPKKSTKSEIMKDQVIKLKVYFEDQYKNAKPKDKIRTLRNLILFKLLATTGQRVSDIVNLKVEVVNKPVLYFQSKKTGSEAIIDNQVVSEILLYINISGLNEHDYLFAVGLARTPISRKTVYQIINAAGSMILGIENFSPHWFRSYVDTELTRQGYTPDQIKAVLGWESVMMVFYYNKLIPKVKGINKGLLE